MGQFRFRPKGNPKSGSKSSQPSESSGSKFSQPSESSGSKSSQPSESSAPNPDPGKRWKPRTKPGKIPVKKTLADFQSPSMSVVVDSSSGLAPFKDEHPEPEDMDEIDDPKQGHEVYDPNKVLPEGYGWASSFFDGEIYDTVAAFKCFQCGKLDHFDKQCTNKDTPAAIAYRKKFFGPYFMSNAIAYRRKPSGPETE